MQNGTTVTTGLLKKVFTSKVVINLLTSVLIHMHLSAVSRSTVLSWCLEKNFELVELDPEEESDTEDDGEDFGISYICNSIWAKCIQIVITVRKIQYVVFGVCAMNTNLLFMLYGSEYSS